ncbi:unnamed protein product, partial [Citrullus colocynthis]
RFALAAGELNGILYAVGGFDGKNYLQYALGGYNGDDFIPTVEVFDPRRGLWTKTEPMNESRGYSATAMIGDTIYVFGGMKNMKLSERVECYKEHRGWEFNEPRSIWQKMLFLCRCFVSSGLEPIYSRFGTRYSPFCGYSKLIILSFEVR